MHRPGGEPVLGSVCHSPHDGLFFQVTFRQGFSTSPLLIFWPSHSVLGGCLVHCRMCLAAPFGFYPLNASSTLFPSCNNKKCLRHCQCPLVGQKSLLAENCSLKRTTGGATCRKFSRGYRYFFAPPPPTLCWCISQIRVKCLCTRQLMCGPQSVESCEQSSCRNDTHPCKLETF